MNDRLIIVDGWIILPDKHNLMEWTIRRGDVVVENGLISSLYARVPRKGDIVLDASSAVILPAFVNAHTHSFEYALKGFKSGRAIDDPHPEWFWSLHNAFPPELALVGAKIHYAENIAAGVGCVCDIVRTGFDPQAFDEVLKSVGLRGMVFGTVPSHLAYDLGNERQDCFSQRLQEASQLPAEAVLHMHYLETTERREGLIERFGVLPGDLLGKYGLIERSLLLSHCGGAQPEDIAIFNPARTLVVTTPGAEARLGDPSFNIAMLQKYGLPIALGSDGPCYNQRVDFFDEMRWLAVRNGGGASGLTPQFLLAAATTAPSRRFQAFPDVICREGAPADLTIVEVSSLSCHPLVIKPYDNILENIVWGACSRDVIGTIVNGRLLWWRGLWLTIDVVRQRQILQRTLTEFILDHGGEVCNAITL